MTRKGLRELLYAIADQLENTPEFPLHEEVEEDDTVNRVIYSHEKAGDQFTITRESDGTFVVGGAHLERLFKMTDFSRDDLYVVSLVS